MVALLTQTSGISGHITVLWKVERFLQKVVWAFKGSEPLHMCPLFLSKGPYVISSRALGKPEMLLGKTWQADLYW